MILLPEFSYLVREFGQPELLPLFGDVSNDSCHFFTSAGPKHDFLLLNLGINQSYHASNIYLYTYQFLLFIYIFIYLFICLLVYLLDLFSYTTSWSVKRKIRLLIFCFTFKYCTTTSCL